MRIHLRKSAKWGDYLMSGKDSYRLRIISPNCLIPRYSFCVSGGTISSYPHDQQVTTVLRSVTQILGGLSANITDTSVKIAEDQVFMSRRHKFQGAQVETTE